MKRLLPSIAFITVILLSFDAFANMVGDSNEDFAIKNDTSAAITIPDNSFQPDHGDFHYDNEEDGNIHMTLAPDGGESDNIQLTHSSEHGEGTVEIGTGGCNISINYRDGAFGYHHFDTQSCSQYQISATSPGGYDTAVISSNSKTIFNI